MEGDKVSDIVTLVLNIQKTGSNELRNSLLHDLKDEAFEFARRHCRKYGREASDEELSVALNALNKAIDSFDLKRSSKFKAFARQIITFKLVDLFRKEKEEKEYDSFDDDKIALISDRKSFSEFKNKEVYKDLDEQRRKEIERFSKIIGELGYSLVDIMENRPKHRDSLQSLQNIAKYIVHLGLGQRFLEENPISRKLKKEIGEGVQRRTLTRYRPYLCAVIVALIHDDFPLMKNYLDFFGKGEKEGGKHSGNNL